MATTQKETLMERGWPKPGVGCNHKGHLSVIVTEMGYHARCLGCKALGPAHSSLKAAQQALLVLGARSDSSYR